MPDLLSFVLICYGCTIILSYGKIFNKIRPPYSFFKCPMCIGFHVGWFFGLFYKPVVVDLSLIENYFSISNYMKDGIQLLASGCISAGASYFLSMIVNDGGLKHDTSRSTYLDKRL